MPSNPPIVLLSGFKAGTWMMRKILTEMTGLRYCEPPIIPGERKYYNADQLVFADGHYYSWHLIPTPEVIERLRSVNAKTIFIARNIYDVVLSIYYHFYNNIDEDIGRGAGKADFLKQFTFEEGLSLIITGFDEQGIRWNGMKEVLEHYNAMCEASAQCDSILLSYDRIVNDKQSVVEELSSFLEISLDTKTREAILSQSSFETMKTQAELSGIGSSHFREGKASHNRKKLLYSHKIQLRSMLKAHAPHLETNALAAGIADIMNEH